MRPLELPKTKQEKGEINLGFDVSEDDVHTVVGETKGKK